MKLGELRKIIADIDTVYDNCDVTCYESNGNLGYASIVSVNGKQYSCDVYGNGDFYHSIAEFKLLED